MDSLTYIAAVGLQTQSQIALQKAHLHATHPGSPQNYRRRAQTSSPRILVAFGTSHKDAVFIARHDEYYQTPGTLPPALQRMFDSGEIPLGTLQKVALGPNGSFFVASGLKAWWNLNGLSEASQQEVGELLQQMQTGESQYGYWGIVDFVMGLRGELALTYDTGRLAMWSDHPPLDPGLVQTIYNIARAGQYFTVMAFGPGNTGVVQPKDRPLPVYRTAHNSWPPPGLQKEMSSINGEKPIRHIACSVVNHEYYYVVRADHDQLDIRFRMPAEAQEKLLQWITEYGVSETLLYNALLLTQSVPCLGERRCDPDDGQSSVIDLDTPYFLLQ
ncbi:hypothetical protein K461DRAFT_324657 [Myriangium duriaei CBS 260.36]|uniref:Uncharacterized protein n=1 Tax=Myriangium duriaei CBS 260.36 TaxID=1168546 RepID=A0A9P4IRD3_9PEZI|nr:hypothetical protein K461DRAFT_324657 [Myriangium duriaei CBS 260.36]